MSVQRPQVDRGKCGKRIAAGPVRRQGVILFGVIVVLLIVMVLSGTMMRGWVQQQAAADDYQRKLQSLMLANAGVDRAIARLDADPTYRGEQWEIPAMAMGGRWSALVIIHVDAGSDRKGSFSVRVESHYPVEVPLRVTHVREVKFPQNSGRR